MNKNIKVRYAASPREVKGMNTNELRNEFLISDIFDDNIIKWVYSHYDRYMTGGVSPNSNDIFLDIVDPIKSNFFLERRELGIINVGQKGSVLVDGKKYILDYKEALYVGRGVENVYFNSHDNKNPAKFYLNSTLAHKSYPTKKISREEAEIVEMGSFETANVRTIRKLIVNSIIKTCQLQMGITELKPGSIWNTMPAHYHDRRMEVYFYFEIPENNAVCHFMGETK